MFQMLRYLVRYYIRDEKAQGMVEYGLILALIAVVVIAALTLIGNNLDTMFNDVANEVDTGGGS